MCSAICFNVMWFERWSTIPDTHLCNVQPSNRYLSRAIALQCSHLVLLLQSKFLPYVLSMRQIANFSGTLSVITSNWLIKSIHILNIGLTVLYKTTFVLKVYLIFEIVMLCTKHDTNCLCLWYIICDNFAFTWLSPSICQIKELIVLF